MLCLRSSQGGYQHSRPGCNTLLRYHSGSLECYACAAATGGLPCQNARVGNSLFCSEHNNSTGSTKTRPAPTATAGTTARPTKRTKTASDISSILDNSEDDEEEDEEEEETVDISPFSKGPVLTTATATAAEAESWAATETQKALPAVHGLR